MWNLNVFINDFLYLAGEQKINIFKILHSGLLFISSMFQLSIDVNCHPILQ